MGWQIPYNILQRNSMSNDQIRHLSYLVDIKTDSENHVLDGSPTGIYLGQQKYSLLLPGLQRSSLPVVTSQGVEIQGDFIKDVGPLARRQNSIFRRREEMSIQSESTTTVGIFLIYYPKENRIFVVSTFHGLGHPGGVVW